MKNNKKIVDVAILIGLNIKGKVVYSDKINIHKYYDGEHPWDSFDNIKLLKMREMRGRLFNDAGDMFQEFIMKYDDNGKPIHHWSRHDDGTILDKAM
jgi:hypothetical protein